jgi:hypothetical protein
MPPGGESMSAFTKMIQGMLKSFKDVFRMGKAA